MSSAGTIGATGTTRCGASTVTSTKHTCDTCGAVTCTTSSVRSSHSGAISNRLGSPPVHAFELDGGVGGEVVGIIHAGYRGFLRNRDDPKVWEGTVTDTPNKVDEAMTDEAV